jgi:hypothetical protein
MASTSSVKRPPSYCFSYGFLGGGFHARKFKRQMQASGYIYDPDPQTAAIIIAHSAGCWYIPKDSTPQLVVYVGMPLNLARPYQTLIAAKHARNKEIRDRRYILPLQLKSIYYGLSQPFRTIRIIRGAKLSKPVILDNVNSIFIVNRSDPWPKSKQLQNFLYRKPWAFINLPGAHDHIWEQPEFYIDIINHYATILAETNLR